MVLTPTLTWSPSSGATSYDVYFGTASPPPYAGNVTMPPYSPGTLSYATTYHWRVVPKNACGSASGCATWSFTTLPMPPSVTLVKKVGNPFKVYGSNLQDGLRVYISGSLWGDTTDPSLVKWKNDGLIVIKKGGALKALFPQGTFVPIRIVNPDGGEITVAFDRQSKTWTTLP